MRLTDSRYSNEKLQFELAIRMIGHEARTRTIRECTGLSDDRIRKVFNNYFKSSGACGVRRRRGKSPRQITLFVKSPEHQLQAMTLVTLYCVSLLIRVDADGRVHPCWPRPCVEFGHRVCRAYETYRVLHRAPALNFEWAWNLLQAISHNDEIYLAACRLCRVRYVQDAYALDRRICPACVIAGN
jgi:hypothetical protein